jgi:Raf kinase inhibitor-like YbhB/YbcL family protein
MELTSSAFAPGADIPQEYTCQGADLSPPLSWTAPPPGTASLALISDDPDATVGTYVHWVLYGLPADRRELPQGLPATETIEGGGVQGITTSGALGWEGPCPPSGPAHRYFFRLYALDADPGLAPGATEADLMQAIEGHTLAQAEFMGRYKRR